MTDFDSFADWVEAKSEAELIELVGAIRDDRLDEERIERLREGIQNLSKGERQDAVAESEFVNDLERELGLEETDPFEAGVAIEPTEQVEFLGLSPEEEEAVSNIGEVLQRSGMGVESWRQIVESLETGQAVSPLISQNDLDNLPEQDRQEFLETARETLEAVRQQRLGLDDFPGIKTRLEPGRNRAYYRARIRELRGEDVTTEMFPQGEIEDAPDSVIQEAIELAEQRIEELEGGGGGGRRGGGGQRDFTADLGVTPSESDEFMGDRFVQDKDYMTGEEITRDLEFEERFERLMRRIGRHRDFDFDRGTDDYFALTRKNQKKFYDVTPEEAIRRAVARGDVKMSGLRRMGFEDDRLPDPDDV